MKEGKIEKNHKDRIISWRKLPLSFRGNGPLRVIALKIVADVHSSLFFILKL